ncbi:MAG: hypothetical protein ACXW3X_15770 [Rhodoplanes sp.]|jgi:hypothetical protein
MRLVLAARKLQLDGRLPAGFWPRVHVSMKLVSAAPASFLAVASLLQAAQAVLTAATEMEGSNAILPIPLSRPEQRIASVEST